jgi:hypothetical protein
MTKQIVALASDIVNGRRDAVDVVAQLRGAYPNPRSFRNMVILLKGTVISHNVFDEGYADAMNAHGDTIVDETRRSELIEFAKKTLKEQLLLQKRCRLYDKRVFTDVRDAAFIAGLVIAPPYLKDIKISDEENIHLKQADSQRLTERSQAVIEVSVTPILAWARGVLASDASAIDDKIVALAIVTGRRMIEIILHGTFEEDGEGETVRFMGQVKAGLVEREAFSIPVLAPAQDVMRAHDEVRSFFGNEITPRQVNSLHCNRLNVLVRETIHPDFHFHSLRTLYALASFEMCRPHTFSINAWGQRVLGHTTIHSSCAYTSMRLVF